MFFVLTSNSMASDVSDLSKLIHVPVSTIKRFVQEDRIPGAYTALVNGSVLLYFPKTQVVVSTRQIIDFYNGKDLETGYMKDYVKSIFKDLNSSNSIKMVNDEGARRLIIFSDPLCSHCREFIKTLKQLHNVTIYTVLVGVLGNKSLNISKSITCSKNNLAAWTTYAETMKVPTEDTSKCSFNALSNNELLKTLGGKSIPMIIFEDGSSIVGGLDLQSLKDKIDSSHIPE